MTDGCDGFRLRDGSLLSDRLAVSAPTPRAPLTREEARSSLVRALEVGPDPWVARELALTLARLEYSAGARDAARRAVVKVDRRIYA
jgi:hypothetical protein